MGMSTVATLCYGVIPIEDEDELVLPWNTEENGGDIDHWWTYEIQGFKHSFEIYHNHNYIDGIEPPPDIIEAYYKELFDFRKTEPKLPVDPIYQGDDNYPILAIPGTVIKAYDGEATRIYPGNMDYLLEEKQSLLEFCEGFGIKHSEPGWLLVSYMM